MLSQLSLQARIGTEYRPISLLSSCKARQDSFSETAYCSFFAPQVISAAAALPPLNRGSLARSEQPTVSLPLAALAFSPSFFSSEFSFLATLPVGH